MKGLMIVCEIAYNKMHESAEGDWWQGEATFDVSQDVK